MIDDVVVGTEDAVGQPVVAQELPDILDRIEFGRSGRQGEDGDIGGPVELAGGVPAGLVHDQDGVGAQRDGG